jgi:hypothetical protein
MAPSLRASKAYVRYASVGYPGHAEYRRHTVAVP